MALVERLQARGLAARIELGGALAPPAARSKLWIMTGRYFAALGGGTVLFNSLNLLGLRWMLLIVAGLTMGAAALLAAATVRFVQPLVSWPRSRPGEEDGTQHLASVLSGLLTRQDRRLGGHILDRLVRVGALGLEREIAIALCRRTTAVISALAAIDARRGEDASVSSLPAAAQAELRREEQWRAVLRADLLRILSRLDHLLLALGRAEGPDASSEMEKVREDIRELTWAADAEAEIRALLEDGKAR